MARCHSGCHTVINLPSSLQVCTHAATCQACNSHSSELRRRPPSHRCHGAWCGPRRTPLTRFTNRNTGWRETCSTWFEFVCLFVLWAFHFCHEVLHMQDLNAESRMNQVATTTTPHQVHEACSVTARATAIPRAQTQHVVGWKHDVTAVVEVFCLLCCRATRTRRGCGNSTAPSDGLQSATTSTPCHLNR